MKKIVLFAAMAVAALSAPAMAKDFEGPRVEVTASVADITNAPRVRDVDYGLAVGYDVNFGRVLVGVEASSDNPFNRDRTIGAAARLGYVASDTFLLYTKVGYENWRNAGRNLDGVRVGAGVEANVSSNAYVKLEGRYADFERGVGRLGAQAGFGLRF